MKVKVPFHDAILEVRGLSKLGRLYREDLDISSWWSSLSKKLTVSGRMDLVLYMDTGVKREMRPKTLEFPYLFLYIY